MQPLRRAIGAENHRGELHVRRRQLRPRAREQPGLRRGDGQRPLRGTKNTASPVFNICRPAQHDVVHRDREPAFLARCAPGSGPACSARPPAVRAAPRCPCSARCAAGPDPRQQQKLRRIDRAAAQDHLAPRPHRPRGAVLAEPHAHRAAALQQHLLGQRVGHPRADWNASSPDADSPPRSSSAGRCA